MLKLDISTSQIVWHKGEQAVIRRISKDGQTITLSLESGCVVDVSAEDLIDDNPDIVYDEVSGYLDEEEIDERCRYATQEELMDALNGCHRYVGDEDAESDPYGLIRQVREEEKAGKFDD